MIAASERQTDKEDYWQHELSSLGIELKRRNELNDRKELEALADNLKQTALQDYKTAFEHDKNIDSSRLDYIIWGCCAGMRTS